MFKLLGLFSLGPCSHVISFLCLHILTAIIGANFEYNALGATRVMDREEIEAAGQFWGGFGTRIVHGFSHSVYIFHSK